MSQADHVRRSGRAVAGGPAPQTRRVTIHTNAITLSALLKWAGIVETGGQAKDMIAAGHLRVNGLIEQRRGRQLRAGDLVQGPEGLRLVIIQAPDAASPTDFSPRVS